MRRPSLAHVQASYLFPSGAGVEAAASAPADAWLRYWERLRRHTVLRDEARFYVGRLLGAVGMKPYARVLDFGCGYGLVAAVLASEVGEVVLWDVSPPMRRRAAETVAHVGNARVVDRVSGAFDVILVNSVVQYINDVHRRRWLRRWRGWLEPSGVVVLSDVPGGCGGRLVDLADTLRLYAREGRLGVLVRERLRDLLSYRRAARESPLVHVSPETLRREAAAAGFTTRVLPESLTCRRRRLAAVLGT
jgi:SAM-dependent methyltransferase